MPKVSIVIPVYNSERYLREALESALAQTFRDFTVICVDDGSTDNSRDLLKEYGSKVTVLQQANKGACMMFVQGLYRVCAPGAKVYVKTSYYASRKAFVDPTHVRFMTEESFEYFKSPNYYGLMTNFRTVSIEYEVRKPFKYLPAYLQKRCRRYLWNVCEEMMVVLEAVKPSDGRSLEGEMAW